MAKLTGNYETVMIFSMKNGEESVTALVDKFQKLIADNATINSVDAWGQRQLSYPINDETVGHYVLVDFTANPDFPAELDRVYKITDGVLRTLIVLKEEPPKVKTKAKAATEPVAEA